MTNRTGSGYQSLCKQSICTDRVHTHAHTHTHTHTKRMILRKLMNPEGGALLYSKRHNVKIGDSQLKSGCLRRRESSPNRTCGYTA